MLPMHVMLNSILYFWYFTSFFVLFWFWSSFIQSQNIMLSHEAAVEKRKTKITISKMKNEKRDERLTSFLPPAWVSRWSWKVQKKVQMLNLSNSCTSFLQGRFCKYWGTKLDRKQFVVWVTSTNLSIRWKIVPFDKPLKLFSLSLMATVQIKYHLSQLCSYIGKLMANIS